jgi:CheY-like chemotaxis protein
MKALNILFADDEQEIAAIVASVLQRAGHSLDVVHDGEAALLKLKEKPGHYHLLITDGNMPGISGIQLIEKLPQYDFHGKTILLSGYLTEELEETYESLHIDRIIQKPFGFTDLKKAVDELGAGIVLNPAK